jgi:hypothetical protein
VLSLVDRREQWFKKIPLHNSTIAPISQYFILNSVSWSKSNLFKFRYAIEPLQPLFNNTCQCISFIVASFVSPLSFYLIRQPCFTLNVRMIFFCNIYSSTSKGIFFLWYFSIITSWQFKDFWKEKLYFQ